MSTLKVTNIQNSSTSSGGVSIDTSGHVTVDGVVMPSSGPLSNRNLIINGAMQVAQRGTSSATNTGYGTVDRFKSQTDSGAITQSQQSLTTGDPYDEGFRYYFRITNTTAATDAAAQTREIQQPIEAQNVALSGWNYASSSEYVTLSFWARSSVSGTYYVLLRSRDGTSQGYTFSFTLVANTWKKVTHSAPGNSNITVNADIGTGLQVRFLVDLGTDTTDNSTTLNTWSQFDDTKRSPDFTHDWAGTTNATFDLTGVQLEPGSVTTPFEHRSYGDELARCQRYYESIAAEYSIATQANIVNFWHSFKVTKRVAPTVTGNITFGGINVYGFSAPTVASAATIVDNASAEL